MSKKLLTFFLSELGIVRIHCPNTTCGGVVEMPVARLKGLNRQADCPVCKGFMRFDNASFKMLGEAICELAGAFKVEFVIPQEAGDGIDA